MAEPIAETEFEFSQYDKTEKLEIAHIELSTELRGGPRQMISLARALRELPAGNHIRQRVIVRRGSAVAAACERIDGVAKIGIRPGALPAARSAKGADIVHVHDEAGVTAGALLSHRGLPFVATRRAVTVPSVNLKTRWAWGRASRIVGVSDRVSSVMRAYLNHSNVSTIVDCVDPLVHNNSISKPKRDDETFIVGCLGPIDFAVKGQDLVVDAARRLLGTCPQVDILIAGGGPDRGRLQDLSDYLPNVKILDWQDDIAAFMRQLDALILPSRFEALGTTILEAMAMAVPVIAADAGGIAELLKHEVNGLLVSRESPDEIAHAVNRLVHDESLVRRLAASSVRTAANHSTARMAEDYYSAYLNTLAREQARRLSI